MRYSIKKRKSKEWSPQKVAYYSSLREAWHNNIQAGIKSILTLSSAGIGLLVGLSNFLTFSSFLQILFFCLGIICFGITIIITFFRWGRNADFLDILIKKCIAKKDKEEFVKKEKKLERSMNCYDKITSWSFALAIIFTIIFAGISIMSNYEKSRNVIDNINNTSQRHME